MPPKGPPGSGYRALRRGRISVAGHCYFVTTVCDRRQRLFADWCVASVVCRAFAEPALWRDSMLLCWVLMPDHLHLLVELGDSESLDALVRRVKAVTSRAARQAACRSEGRTWMPGFHERLMRGGLNKEAVARYIVANPVRAGLVASCRDYPYWDAIWLDQSRLPPLPQGEFRS